MGTLATSLATIRDYYLASLTDDHTARIFARDWLTNSLSLAAALVRAGSSVWWLDRDASSTDEHRFIIASIDPAGDLRFDAATDDGMADLPSAERYDWLGVPLG